MPIRPSSPLSVVEIGAKYGNETAHGRQVAALAVKLFDATHVLFGIPASDRRLLEAAGVLHDMGYAAQPRRHAEFASVRIRREGLAGFSADDRRWISLLIRLHPASLTLEAGRALAKRHPEATRILYSAALLRIADGLDYAHLQDAAIVSARATQRTVRIGIHCAYFPKNYEVARRQSGRWREVFPADVNLQLYARGPARPPLLSSGLSVHEAIRRLVFPQYRTILLNVAGALEAADDEALHDLRIAVRRIRTILRAFRRQLALTSARRIDRDLQQLNRVLGTARDLDVWIGFFSTESISEEFTRHRLWAKFLAHQLALRRLQQATVRRHLHGAAFNALQLRIGRLLRVELPVAAASAASPPLERPARRALARSLRRALGLGSLRHSRSPEKLHQLRIALRRLRYLGAFFESALGRPVRKMSRRTHALERVLGQMRDADLALARFQEEGPAPPRALLRRLERIRAANAAALDSAWARFEDPQFILALRRQLRN